MNNKPEKIKNMSFESSLSHIENLADQLEKGELSLKDTVFKYKEAMSVLDHAGNLLNSVKEELQIVDSISSNTKTRKSFVEK